MGLVYLPTFTIFYHYKTTIHVGKYIHARWFKVTFLTPSWRSLNLFKRSLNHPQKVTKKWQVEGMGILHILKLRGFHTEHSSLCEMCEPQTTRSQKVFWTPKLFCKPGGWMFPKIVVPQIIHGLIGFSIIFTIHFGGPPLIFGNTLIFGIPSVLPSDQSWWFSQVMILTRGPNNALVKGHSKAEAAAY